ncbi:histidine kinase dimerization/phosphoacceptor domain -containing protein [Arsenicibacter rosenii]|uniref:histidine kinase n=1 Tax=Arsenicibacter rosenii TaxID=1750698 RepID=A0A1S2VKN9_9BACT|nr:histidine kinase dimerization/phosphoacceptor domain -containing protein [Arsenicibacter rosenii]OIN59334.1 hypothetical protein BLX24_10155 [Arsenicibacter rosenii]
MTSVYPRLEPPVVKAGCRPLLIRFIIYLLVVLPWLATAQTRPIIITDQYYTGTLEGSAEVLQSTVTSTEIPNFQNAFKPFHATSLAIGNSEKIVYWLRFSVRNESHEHLYGMLTHGGYSKADLYEWDGKKTKLLSRGGMDVSVKDLYIPHTSALMPLALAPHQQKVYLLRIERVWIKQSPLRIYTETGLLRATQLQDISESIFIGYLLGICLFILSAWWLSKETAYLLLFLHIVMQLVQHIVGAGLITGYFNLPAWLSGSTLFTILLGVVGITSCLFQRHFLQVNRYGNRLIHYGYYVHGFGYLLISIIALFDTKLVLDLNSAFSGMCYFFVLYSDFYVARRGYKPAKYLLVSQIWPVIFLPIALLPTEGYLTVDIQLMLNIFVMLSLTGYAFTVGYKVRLFKDEAEAMILEQNQKLEGIVADRTKELTQERDRADVQSERLRLALRELNHRVRNNLAVVSSLLKLQSNNIDPDKTKQVFAESRQRVDAMALIHQQLYQSEELTTIDVPVFITNLVQVLSDAYGYTPATLRVQLSLETVILPVEKAVPLSLLLNEVLTNAFKYGLSRASQPTLSIALQAGGEAIRLDITDNGPGIDLSIWQTKINSFGRRLVDGLTRQLKGEYTIENQSGTTFRFTLPIHQDLLVLE